MIFSDGECPNCNAPQLHLNTLDLLECPRCGMVCAGMDGLVATVMPFLGDGNFRFEDSKVIEFKGTAFAPSLKGGVVADDSKLFASREKLAAYVSSLDSSRHDLTKGRRLAIQFAEAFARSILASSVDDLRTAVASRRARTKYYADSVLPSIANDLRLVHGKEEFTVDHVAATLSSSGHAVPQIYAESENDYSAATHEIRKLCSLNAPLRVLITFSEAPFKSEPVGGAYAQLREWQSIVRANYEVNRADFRGTILIVVAVPKGQFITHSACAFHRTGELSIPLASLATRKIG